MNLERLTISSRFLAFSLAISLCVPAQLVAQDQGIEELTRGPVHEAFAASISFNPEPGLLAPTGPPRLIEEIPPDQRMGGDNVAWIPGYWGWEEDPGDYIWISGIWRNLPPGRQWLPGYWGEAESQWQWTSGYWADEQVQEVAYLPHPPKSLEAGPNIDSPSANHIWISGNWIHRDDRYAWTPGYWEPAQSNWIWIPARYQWTHRGYVFVNGYWDYNVARRGVLFAPVRFQGDVYNRSGYSYTPHLVISLDVFLGHLFVRPTYGHYYFGDYYSSGYRNSGYYASSSYGSSRFGYDPIFAHNRWNHRNDRDWEQNQRDNFNFYRDHEDARPPHSWAALQARPKADRRGKRDNFEIAQPLASYAGRPDTGQRFQAVSKNERGKIIEQREKVRDYGQQRRQTESQPNLWTAKKGAKPEHVERQKLAKSPLVAKRPQQLSGADAPPRQQVRRDSERAGKPTVKPGQDMPKRADQTKADPSRKGDGAPSPKGKMDKPIPSKKSEPQARPQAKPAAGPDRSRAKTVQPDRKITPKPSPKTTREPSRRPDPQPKREAKPEKRDPKVDSPKTPRQQPPQKASPEKKKAAQPQRGQPARPEPTPARKQPSREPARKQPSREPARDTPKNKPPKEDTSKEKTKGHKK